MLAGTAELEELEKSMNGASDRDAPLGTSFAFAATKRVSDALAVACGTTG